MSYRTYVNDYQIFGNDECYPEWIEYIESKGIEVNEEGCYEGELDDFMEALSIIEKITINMEQERKKDRDALEKECEAKGLSLLQAKEEMDNHYGIRSLFDLQHIYNKVEHTNVNEFQLSLLDELMEITKNSYMFLPYTFYLACKDTIKPCRPFSTHEHLHCYKLHKGKTIKISAG